MQPKLFNKKIKIEIIKQKLSNDNIWIPEYVLWNELWASVSIKYIFIKKVLYFFIIKWRRYFPNNFRVTMDDKIFMPTQIPIANPTNDYVMFHAEQITKGE
ncbi:MAG: hypothetical protein LBB12_03375 [Holosporaceae bacterium]|jgi:hypothetical protein|nr:hypothetical protein [Holosporaceae bacterium]